MCECGQSGKLRRGMRGACYARWLRQQSTLTIDHLCEVKNCVNPAHMEPVTRGENVRRAQRPRRCAHCDLFVVPANLSRHVAARHSGATT